MQIYGPGHTLVDKFITLAFTIRVYFFSALHCRRVHISDKTLAFLNGEFEVEPAFGEKREELLRIAGLKTYFITKVVKPVSVEWLAWLVKVFTCSNL